MKISKEVEQEIIRQIQDKLDRLSSRRDKTREVATAIFMRTGDLPSAATVRSFTNQGSITDIQRDLNEMRDEIRGKLQPRIQTPGLPESLAEAAGALLSSMWDKAIADATAAFEEDRAKLAEFKTSIDARLSEETYRRTAAENRAATLSEEVVLERQRRLDAEKTAEAAMESRRVADETIERLTRDLEMSRQDIEARKRTALMVDGETRFMKLQVEEAQSKTQLIQGQLAKANDDKVLDADRHQKLCDQLRSDNSAMQRQNGDLSARVSAAMSRIEELEKQLKQEASRREGLEKARAADKARMRGRTE